MVHELGTIVKTNFGTGVISGYEDSEFYSSPRYQVTLDDPERWVFSKQGQSPYFFEREIEVLSN